ncbi:MAG: outer membrane beta-barrel protein [Cyclobacteriaceae bacterium]|nr:outer membrane beta-barrel protein [Cyclobacteriaceae bacterium]
MNRPFLGLFLASFLVLFYSLAFAQKEVTYSIGIFSGISSSFINDEGISQDARYKYKYNVRTIPFGVHLGLDFNGYGFMIDPQITEVGQIFNILNTNGGQVGRRDIRQQYFQIPFSYKKHIIDLSFFKVSWVFGVSPAILLSASETISHDPSKLRFPAYTFPVLQSPEFTALGYEVEYDGVNVPQLNKQEILRKEDFKSFQLFGSIGLRSDWDVTDHARLSFDLRANVGLWDPRSNDYLDRAKNQQTLYELSGARRDIFVSLTLGYARYLSIERKTRVKKVTPFQYYGPKRKKPK